MLFYWEHFGDNKTTKDKEYDACISHTKVEQGNLDRNNPEEEQFALETLPGDLEKHCGYKLLIRERDLIPSVNRNASDEVSHITSFFGGAESRKTMKTQSCWDNILTFFPLRRNFLPFPAFCFTSSLNENYRVVNFPSLLVFCSVLFCFALFCLFHFHFYFFGDFKEVFFHWMCNLYNKMLKIHKFLSPLKSCLSPQIQSL